MICKHPSRAYPKQMMKGLPNFIQPEHQEATDSQHAWEHNVLPVSSHGQVDLGLKLMAQETVEFGLYFHVSLGP